MAMMGYRLHFLVTIHASCSIFLTKGFVVPSKHQAFPPSVLYGAAAPVTGTSSNDSAHKSAYQVSISYCTGCRWGLRSFWMAQELLTTFQDDVKLQAITVQPSSTVGTFQVKCHIVDENQSNDNVDVVLWDRRERGRFPEMKEIKQLLRDEVEPTRFLGHSDTESRKYRQADSESTVTTNVADESTAKNLAVPASLDFEYPRLMGAQSPDVAIVFCTGCKWLFRAAWFAQEFTQTFADEIKSMSLLPARPPVKGGTFQIRLDGAVVWDRAAQGEFPDIKVVKQMLRDRLRPGKDLGHTDQQKMVPFVEMDDDEAEEARRLFGVL